MSADALKAYLNVTGILSCNVNPYLPSLGDIDCTWADAVELIDRHALFYSKVYRKRTVYLSPEVYYLLKAVRSRPAMTPPAEVLYGLLQGAPGLETGELRRLSQLGQTEFVKAMDFLLEETYVTALANGTWLNPNWSTFRYGTAGQWEDLVPAPALTGDPAGRLRDILSRSLAEDEVERLIR